MVQQAFLQSADRHIAEIDGLILRQLELIHRLGSSGQDTSAAMQFLAKLEDARRKAVEARAEIAKQDALAAAKVTDH